MPGPLLLGPRRYASGAPSFALLPGFAADIPRPALVADQLPVLVDGHLVDGEDVGRAGDASHLEHLDLDAPVVARLADADDALELLAGELGQHHRSQPCCPGAVHPTVRVVFAVVGVRLRGRGVTVRPPGPLADRASGRPGSTVTVTVPVPVPVPVTVGVTGTSLGAPALGPAFVLGGAVAVSHGAPSPGP